MVIVSVVQPSGSQKTDENGPPVTVSVPEFPEQIAVVPDITGTGAGISVIFSVTTTLQP